MFSCASAGEDFHGWGHNNLLSVELRLGRNKSCSMWLLKFRWTTSVKFMLFFVSNSCDVPTCKYLDVFTWKLLKNIVSSAIT